MEKTKHNYQQMSKNDTIVMLGLATIMMFLIIASVVVPVEARNRGDIDPCGKERTAVSDADRDVEAAIDKALPSKGGTDEDTRKIAVAQQALDFARRDLALCELFGLRT